MHRSTKILLIVLGLMIVLSGGLFGYLKISGAGNASADMVEGELKSFFGDTVVIVKDKQTNKPVQGASVELFGRYDKEELNKYYSYKCSRHTLLTDSAGKVFFTKANSSNNLKTRIKGSAVFKLLGFEVYRFTAGTSNCIYNVTVTGPGPVAGETAYSPYTTTWSWPGKGIDGALPYNSTTAFLGNKGVFLEKQGYGAIKANLKLSQAINGSSIPKNGADSFVVVTAKLDRTTVEFTTPSYNNDTGNFFGKLPVPPTGKSYKITFSYLTKPPSPEMGYFLKEVSGVTFAKNATKDLGSVTLIKK